MNLLSDLNHALTYIEDHLTDELRTEDIAAAAYMSPFHFQKMFSALCGMTLGEYIRGRRLTLAAQALSSGELRVIDAAMRCGYDSPDSFARAFTRFHGISPSQAKERGARLNAIAPLRICVSLEGGSKMEYRIVEKPAFTIMGVSRKMQGETSYQDIPAFWQDYMKLEDKAVWGAFGACIHGEENGTFDYMIADLYTPWEDIPEGHTTHTFPAGTWAIFPCRGELPRALQEVNTRIWKEWLPSLTSYKLGGMYNLEMYAPPAEKPENTYSEIWVPLVKA